MALPMDIETLKSTIGRRTGLAKANRFAVYIPLPLISLSPASILGNIVSGNTNPLQVFNDPRDISLLCESVTLPGRTIATTDYQTSPKVKKQAYGFINDDVSFTFMLTGDYYIKNVMTGWQDQIMNQQNYELAFKDDYVSTIIIQQLNDKNIPVYTCQLNNAFPVSVSSIELGNTNENTASRVTVSFAYDDWEEQNLAGTLVGAIANALF
jgi:hypothetical protein